MSGIKIPVPVFVSCDETSLKVRVVETKGTEAQDSFPPKGYTLKLECKEMHQEWGSSDVRAIAVGECYMCDNCPFCPTCPASYTTCPPMRVICSIH